MRKRRVGSEVGGVTMGYKFIPLFGVNLAANFALVFLLFNSHPSFAAGCDVLTKENYPNANEFEIIGVCSSLADAQQACGSKATSLGYTSGMCHLGSEFAEWDTGWLCSPPVSPGTCPSPSSLYSLDFYSLEYYTSADANIQSMVGPTCNCAADPINPAAGAVYRTDVDVNGLQLLSFNRFFNSTDMGGADLGVGWRHSFSRSIQARTSTVIYRPYSSADSKNSSVYSTPDTACISGFNQIRSHVPNWQNATAIYNNGICQITRNTLVIGSLPVFAFQPQSVAQQVPTILNSLSGSGIVAYDVIRDDGQLIGFTIQNGTIVAPPGINLKLQQTSAGFTITDANDNVEQYDATGKLLTITSRGGVVQTMNYDSSGRLSNVTDSFGHQLIFSYDAQGRLNKVTRQ